MFKDNPGAAKVAMQIAKVLVDICEGNEELATMFVHVANAAYTKTRRKLKLENKTNVS
jgi:hypothetical protein